MTVIRDLLSENQSVHQQRFVLVLLDVSRDTKRLLKMGKWSLNASIVLFHTRVIHLLTKKSRSGLCYESRRPDRLRNFYLYLYLKNLEFRGEATRSHEWHSAITEFSCLFEKCFTLIICSCKRASQCFNSRGLRCMRYSISFVLSNICDGVEQCYAKACRLRWPGAPLIYSWYGNRTDEVICDSKKAYPSKPYQYVGSAAPI